MTSRERFAALFLRWEAMLVYLLIVVVIVFSRLSPFFLDLFNIMNTTLNFTERAIIALPMMYVIISGDIDISVASIMALASVFMGMAAEVGVGIPGLIVIGLLTGLLAGMLNGFLITWFDVPSIAVAIGAMSLYRGIAYAILGDKAFTSYSLDFNTLGQGYVPGTIIPIQLVIFIVLAVVFGYVLHRTRFGRETFAIGNNATAARFSGINVKRHRFINFALLGLMSGLAAVLLTARILSTRPNIANGWELDVVTTVVLGGVAITGGKGNIFGVIVGIFLLGILKYGMGLINIPGRVMSIVTGILLIVAILLPEIINAAQKRRELNRTRQSIDAEA
jgi:rhamnose transport system permease protein